MTVQEIKALVADEFGRAIKARKSKADAAKASGQWEELKHLEFLRWPGDVRQDVPIPAGVTPQVFHVSIAPNVAEGDGKDARLRFAKPAAETLMSRMLAEGCNTFAPVEVQDRPAVKVGKAKRPRAIVVRVIGWKS